MGKLLVSKENINSGVAYAEDLKSRKTAAEIETGVDNGNEAKAASKAIPLDKRKPRKLYSSIFTSTKKITIASFGDSLALEKINHIIPMMDRYCGGAMSTGVEQTATVNKVSTSGFDLFASGGTPTTGQFDEWLNGEYNLISNETASYIQFGAAPTFRYVKVFYIRESGGGSFDLDIAGNTEGTVNTSNTEHDAGVLSVDMGSLAQRTVEIVATGSVKIVGVHVETGLNGIDWYSLFFNKGGLLLSSAMSNDSTRRALASVLSALDIDLVTFEMDDDWGQASDREALDYLFGIFDSELSNTDKLIIASTPRASEDAGKLLSSEVLESICADADRSYLFFNSYKLMGTYDEMIAIFGTDDGIHPTENAQAYAATIIYDFLGLNTAYAGVNPSPVNALSAPSTLATNSEIIGTGGNSVSFVGDPSFGLDWEVVMPRSITIKDNQGTEMVRFGRNPNFTLLPMNFDALDNENFGFVSATGPWGYDVRINDSDRAAQAGAGMVQCLVKPPEIPRAVVLAWQTNQYKGVRVRCTDGTQGDKIYVGTGSGWEAEDGSGAL